MRVVVGLALAFGLSLAAQSAAGAASDQSRLLTDLKALQAPAQKNDCVAGLPIARRVTADPGFDDLMPDDAKLAVWTLVAMCSGRTNDLEGMLEAARHATAFQGAADVVWVLRIEGGIDLDRPDDVAEAAQTLVHVRPLVLSEIPERQLSVFRLTEIAKHRKDALEGVLRSLEAANYQPISPVESADELWLAYAQIAADTGDQAHAAKLVGRLTEVESLMPAKLDARFAAEVAASPAQFDLKAAAERQVDHDRAVMAAHPELLEAVWKTSWHLRGVGRYAEALALDQAALAKATDAPGDKPAFVDQALVLNRLNEEMSEAFSELGRTPEALAAEKSAARLPEMGNKHNVSQTLDYAGDLNANGRPEDVLKLLAPFEKASPASPFGWGVFHMEKACAYAQLSRTAELKAELDYLAAHQADNPGARTEALLCANDTDAVAADIIARLQDPDQREAALASLCSYDDPRTKDAWSEKLNHLYTTAAGRPDVLAAVAKAGHTEHIPLDGDVYWVGF